MYKKFVLENNEERSRKQKDEDKTSLQLFIRREALANEIVD